MRRQQSMGDLFHIRLVAAPTNIPRRTDIDTPAPYRQNKHVLFGHQEGRCNGCRREFPFRFLEVEHIIPSRGKWPGQYRELAAALCPLQSGEGRLASGVRND